MKVLNKVVIGVSSLFLLAACGPTKVSYEKFHDAAVAAAKNENGFTKVKFSGKAKIKEEGKVTEYDFGGIEFDGYTNGRMDSVTVIAKMAAILLEGNEAKAIALSLSLADAEAVTKDDQATYYINGFQVDMKVDEQKSTIKFDKNGLPISYKYSGEGSGSVSLSWSK